MEETSKHILSKSSYIAGSQCHLKLWYSKNRPDLREPLSPMIKAIFEQGHRVGELATQLFPGGELIEYQYGKTASSIDLTKKKIEEGCSIIYEACFQFQGVFIAIDILVKQNGKWNAYEVKSSASVKRSNVKDAAIQYWVMSNADLEISDI
ncbi:MAG: DUF2779 domain-containing protein, partial [Flavobacteriales bacterium]|nr:DUF2779 domain-containing protein [Flavobacteriales bacterium]